MKLNKSLLVTTLLASSVLLVACNEKNKEEKTSMEPKNKTEQVKNKEKAVTKKKATAEEVALNQFNNAATITFVSRQIGKNEQNEDTVSFAYTIENKGDKAIKEIQWFNVVLIGSTIVDVVSIPAVFETPLAPKATEELLLTKLAKNYPENVRAEMLNPQTSVQFSQTIAGKILFEDGTQAVVTTPEDINEYLQEIPKQ